MRDVLFLLCVVGAAVNAYFLVEDVSRWWNWVTIGICVAGALILYRDD